MAMTQPNSMTQTPVNRMFFMMAAPISLGMLSTFLFQIVDTFFVGQLGSAALAALAFASTAYFLFVGLFIGLSIGVSAVVAKAAGGDDTLKTQTLVTVALLLVLFTSLGLSLVAYIFIDPMFIFLGAEAHILPLIRRYMTLLYLGIPLLMLGIVGSGIVRATGTIKLTEIIFALAGIVNLVFDYLLIFGIGPFPELGLAGAAIASVLSFGFVFVGVMSVMISKGLIRVSAIRNMATSYNALTEILKLALPTVGMQIMIPATGMFTISILAQFGTDIVAAFGVATRIEALALIGIFAVSSAMTPFVAQNFGAEKHTRIDSAIVFAGKASVYIGLLVFFILAIFGSYIARIFSTDPAVISFVGLYFRIVAISYILYGLFNVTSAIFNGLQMPVSSLRLMLVRTFIFTMPLLVIASFINATAILVALTVSNILAGLYAGMLMRRSIQQWNRPLADVNPWDDYKANLKNLFKKFK